MNPAMWFVAMWMATMHTVLGSATKRAASSLPSGACQSLLGSVAEPGVAPRQGAEHPLVPGPQPVHPVPIAHHGRDRRRSEGECGADPSRWAADGRQAGRGPR